MLNNGVQNLIALAALATHGMYRLIATQTVATALAAQVMLGADTPFRQDLHRLRQYQGSREVARAVLRLMAGSRLREAHCPHDIDGEIQDPYNLRCAAQILGPCLELVWRAQRTIEIEAKSVTDNPILLMAGKDSLIAPDSEFFGKYVEVVSGGHFHGMLIAVDVYGLIQAAAIQARLSNTWAQRYVEVQRNKGLGPQLKWSGPPPPEALGGPDPAAKIKRQQAQSSALMVAEYTSAGLVNWIWGQAIPSRAAEGGWHPLALEERRLSQVSEAALDVIGRHFAPVTVDRPLGPDLARLGRAILDGEIVAAVEAHSDAFRDFAPERI